MLRSCLHGPHVPSVLGVSQGEWNSDDRGPWLHLRPLTSVLREGGPEGQKKSDAQWPLEPASPLSATA